MAKGPGQKLPEGQTAEPEGEAPFQVSDGMQTDFTVNDDAPLGKVWEKHK